MMNGAKKGQKPKKPIKQKPVKAMTGLEIAAIGALAGMAGSTLMGGGKQAAATPLNNPAALIAPLSGFVGKEEEKEKAPGMKMGGLSGGKRYGAPPKKGPMSQGMKDGGMTYNDKMGMEGGSSMGQKDIQVKKKVFKGIF
jgi:hypothetical protein